MPWNPAVEQLPWRIKEMATLAARNGWTVGLKNGKWLGSAYDQVASGEDQRVTSMERAWGGLATWAAAANCEFTFIHRGVDVPEKGEYRGALVHKVVERLAKKFPKAGRYFDPSHSLGPKLRDQIVEEVVKAMRMKVNNGNDFLYTGILIEAGTAPTDTEQHITLNELRVLIEEIGKFRKFGGPFLPKE